MVETLRSTGALLKKDEATVFHFNNLNKQKEREGDR
jgi:hypothetical protein